MRSGLTRRRLLAIPAGAAFGQMAQNPSPMTDSTREHRRVSEQAVSGERLGLSGGSLLLPGARGARIPLVIHFHGAPWLAEWSVRQWMPRAATATFNLGSGSGVYSRAFGGAGRFGALLEEAEGAAKARMGPVVLSSFSAGYGAIREILKAPENRNRLDAVLLMDSLHSGYGGAAAPGPVEREPLEPFAEWARRAASRGKRMLITHSEVYPGTFASTTETADWLLRDLEIRRRAVLKWGPMGMQQLSEARAGRFMLMGFAGNTAADHVDHFHGMSWWLKRLGMPSRRG